MYNNEALKNIKQMSDIDKVKLYLGGYKKCSNWVDCDIKCSVTPISDEEIKPLLELKEKFNLTLRDIMTLYVSYWNGQFKPYKNDCGILIPSLEKEFLKFRKEKIYKNIYFWDDRVGERDFKKLILSDDVKVCEFMKKYNLTELDFMILAKTKIHGFVFSMNIGRSDKFVPDLNETLISSLGDIKVKKLEKVAMSKSKNLER